MESSSTPQLSCCRIVPHFTRGTDALGNLHNLLKFQGFCASYGFGDLALLPSPAILGRTRYFGRHGLRGASLWLNQSMFARKIRVEYEENGRRLPCPLKWLDSFSMRNFTNARVFDDTLPLVDGQMEIGKNIPLSQLREAMEDWFRKKSYLSKEARLLLSES
jgi:hypothetical protein